jgi:hypothetical protein
MDGIKTSGKLTPSHRLGGSKNQAMKHEDYRFLPQTGRLQNTKTRRLTENDGGRQVCAGPRKPAANGNNSHEEGLTFVFEA